MPRSALTIGFCCILQDSRRFLCCTQPQRLPRYTIFTNERAFKTMGYISIRLTKPTFFMQPKLNVPQSSLIKFSTFSSLGVLLGDQVIQIMIECCAFTLHCLTSGVPTHLPRRSQNKTLEAALVGVVPWCLVYIMLIIYLYIPICLYIYIDISRSADPGHATGTAPWQHSLAFAAFWVFLLFACVASSLAHPSTRPFFGAIWCLVCTSLPWCFKLAEPGVWRPRTDQKTRSALLRTQHKARFAVFSGFRRRCLPIGFLPWKLIAAGTAPAAAAASANSHQQQQQQLQLQCSGRNSRNSKPASRQQQQQHSRTAGQQQHSTYQNSRISDGPLRPPGSLLLRIPSHHFRHDIR